MNPEGIAETEALFEWGTSSTLGQKTTAQNVATTGPVEEMVAVAPNSTLFFQLVGFDENVKPPEQLATKPASTTIPAVPPRILGTPIASFVSASSAALSGRVNPETEQYV